MNTYELQFLDFIQEHMANSFWDAVMPIITHLGDAGILWIVLCLILLINPKSRKLGGIIALSLIIEALLCNVCLKPLTMRIRPYDLKELLGQPVELLIGKQKDYSFPSGHTGAAFAFVSPLIYRKNPWWIPAALLAALMAFSRMYLYVHYPTDILVGVLLGFLSGIAAILLFQWMEKKIRNVKN